MADQKLSIVVYDCEIIKAIPPKDGNFKHGIEYCEGWRDFRNMGISCICAYDYQTERYRVFLKDNFSEFNDLVNSTKFLVGFNSMNFDDKLLAANDFAFWEANHELTPVDLLRASYIAAGLNPDGPFSSAHAGFSLEKHTIANFGLKKTASGELAPVLWQEGKIGKVIDYCLEDVRLTKMLLDQILDEQRIKHPNNSGDYLTIWLDCGQTEYTIPDF